MVVWGQAAVSSVASCCPGLQVLQCNLLPAVSVAPLAQLHSLTKLCVGLFASVQDGSATSHSVAALTHLQHLHLLWCNDDSVELDALVPLTALRQLSCLRCCAARHPDFYPHDLVLLDNEVSMGWA